MGQGEKEAEEAEEVERAEEAEGNNGRYSIHDEQELWLCIKTTVMRQAKTEMSYHD
jgi:hypothetical protein